MFRCSCRQIARYKPHRCMFTEGAAHIRGGALARRAARGESLRYLPLVQPLTALDGNDSWEARTDAGLRNRLILQMSLEREWPVDREQDGKVLDKKNVLQPRLCSGSQVKLTRQCMATPKISGQRILKGELWDGSDWL